MFKKTLLGISLLSIMTTTALAVPNQLTYSGRLLQNGALVNTSLPMIFSIHTDPTAGTQLWSQTIASVEVNQGIYSVALGEAGNMISPNMFVTDNAYLQVAVNGETLLPRTKINSVGYALQAGAVTGLSNLMPSSGNVGLGNALPQNKLVVSNGGAVGIEIDPSGHYSGSGGVDFHSFDRSGTGYKTITLITKSSNDSLTITAVTGNVGIGTKTPEAKLNAVGPASGFPALSGTTQTGVVVRLQNADSNAVLDLGTNSTGGAWLQSTGRTNLTNNFPLLLNPNGGNVGIGTTSPLYPLDVRGKFNVSTIPWISSDTYVGSVVNTNLVGVSGAADYQRAQYVWAQPNSSAWSGQSTHVATGMQVDCLTSADSLASGKTLEHAAGIGVQYGTQAHTSTIGTINNAYGLYAIAYHGANSIINNMYDVYLAETGTGTVGNHWGIYQSNNIPNYFAGKVGIGTTNPMGKLDIRQENNIGRQLVLGTTSASSVGQKDGEIVFTKGPNFYDSWKLYSMNINAGNGQADLFLDSYLSTSAFQNVVTFKMDGRVGIGTTNPGHALDVSQSGAAYIGLNAANGGGSYEAGIRLKDNGVNKWDIFKGASAGGNNLHFYSYTTATAVLSLKLSNGYVGIGVIEPGHMLSLAGGAYCDGTGAWIAGSDRNYKREIKDLTQYGLKDVLKLRPVTYIHKEDKENRVQLGFIAQEVKPVIAEVVEGQEGSYGIAYDRLTPILVNAIKELKAENEVMKAEIEMLKKK
ncbi:MAG: tail fiber domain-containing protein [Candidatus Margulisiibacteriota bacterium]|jgi:hypothetical protein